MPVDQPETAALPPAVRDLLSDTEISLIEEFAARRVSPGHRKQHDYAFAAFQRWCELHCADALPASPHDILRYLHLHRDRWGWGQMWGVVAAISFMHIEAGLLDATREGRIREYLSAVRRSKGRYVEKKQVDAIRTEDVAAMARTLGAASPDVVRVRFVIAVLYATGTDRLADVLDSRRLRIQLDDDAARVSVGTRRGILDDLTPGALAAVREFTTSGEHLTKTDPAGLGSKIGDAWARAGIPGSWSKDLSRLAPADLQWLLANAEPGYQETARAVAYLLVGHALGRRHAEMADLLLCHLTERPGGWQVLIARSKTDPHGRGETLPLDHDDDSGLDCDVICGACALEALLEVHLRCHGRSIADSARIVPADLTSGARWSTAQAAGFLQRWWADTGLDPEARIGTRGIRAGTATSLSEREVPLIDISQITLHRNLTVLLRYIRRYDPVRWHYHLPV